LRIRRSGRYKGNDSVAVINNHDIVTYDKILMPTPFGMNRDKRLGHLYNAHGARHNRPDAHGKIDIVHPRHIAAGEHGLSNPGLLL